MKKVFRVVIGVAALTLVGAGMASAQVQDDSQQTCINKVNKDAIKVEAAQGKANNDCVKDFVKGAISGPSAANNCILNDPKNKVEGKQQNVLNDEMKKCDLVNHFPDFGYVSGAFAGTTAYQAEVDIIHDVFGNPVDPGLFICDTNPAECNCQRQATGRIGKLSRAMGKYFVKCKKAALAIGKLPQFPSGAASATDLARCLTDTGITLSVAADTKGKVADATQQLQDTVQHFCYTIPTSDEFGGGVCNGLSPNAANLATCVAKRVKCRFCKMVQAMDALGGTVNCSTFSGTTCP